MNESGPIVEFTCQYGNTVALSLVCFVAAAALLGIGTTDCLHLDVWLRAAAEVLRKM